MCSHILVQMYVQTSKEMRRECKNHHFVTSYVRITVPYQIVCLLVLCLYYCTVLLYCTTVLYYCSVRGHLEDAHEANDVSRNVIRLMGIL